MSAPGIRKFTDVNSDGTAEITLWTIDANQITPGADTQVITTTSGTVGWAAASGGGGSGTATALSGTGIVTSTHILDGTIAGADLNSTIAIPSGATATTQTADDNSTKIATTAYADTIKALLFERGLIIGKAGALPTTSTDGADTYLPLPFNMTLRRMKVTAKSVTSSMVVQLRKSTDSGANWSDVSNFVVTFSSGDKLKVVDPANVDLAEGDLIGLSITGAGSGSDLLVEVVAIPR